MALPFSSVWDVLPSVWLGFWFVIKAFWPLLVVLLAARLGMAWLGGRIRRRRRATPGGYPADWDDLRRAVYRRAGHRCQNCGRGGLELHAHHIVPLSVGGTNAPTNLACLCRDCHEAIHPHMKESAPPWAEMPAPPRISLQEAPQFPDAKLRW